MVTVAFKFVPQTTATTFAFSSVFILLLWLYRPPCTQLRTDLRYSLPQFLRAQYLPKVRQQESNVYAYILYLPSTVKVSRRILSGVTRVFSPLRSATTLIGPRLFVMWR